jgi:hypothetical protein
MSNEFKILYKLMNEKKVQFKLKKSIKDNFIMFLLISKETKSSKFPYKIILNLYLILLNDWIWIIFSIILAIKIDPFYLLMILIPILIKRFLNSVGQGFIIYDAQNNEKVFDILWKNQVIGIFSTETKEDLVINEVNLSKGRKPIPKIIIDSYGQDWREELGRFSDYL